MTEIEKDILILIHKYHVSEITNYDALVETAKQIAKLVEGIQAATWNAAREIEIIGFDSQSKYPSLTDYNNRSEPLNEKK